MADRVHYAHPGIRPLRESRTTSIGGSAGLISLIESRRLMKGKATPACSGLFWFSLIDAGRRFHFSRKTESDSVRSKSALEARPMTRRLSSNKACLVSCATRQAVADEAAGDEEFDCQFVATLDGGDELFSG